MAIASPHRMSLADVLLKEKIIDKDQYRRALDEYERTKRSLVRILTDMGVLNDDLRMDILRKHTDCELVRLKDVVPSAEVSGYVTRDMCHRSHAVPLRIDEAGVLIAMEDPTDIRTLGDFEKIFGMTIRPVLASAVDIADTIERLPEPMGHDSLDEIPKPSIGFRLFSSIALLTIVFGPLILFYFVTNRTVFGGEWMTSWGLGKFETVLFYVVSWSSWAAIAYFIHDMIFHRVEK